MCFVSNNITEYENKTLPSVFVKIDDGKLNNNNNNNNKDYCNDGDGDVDNDNNSTKTYYSVTTIIAFNIARCD